MFNIIKEEINWGGVSLSLETGKIARQADGAVVATMGGTTVLCTAVWQKEPRASADFFPLTVHYREMHFAARKIPGGFLKREGRPSEKEILTSRLIDRPIRPLFPAKFFHEVQIISTVISYDGVNDPDVLALIGSSAALAISGAPFLGPVAAARVGYKDGEFILNPKVGEELKGSDLDLVVAGTSDSVLMVESEAKILSESVMLDAVIFGHQQMQPVLDMVSKLAKRVNKPVFVPIPRDDSELEKEVKRFGWDVIRAAYAEPNKQLRTTLLSQAKKNIINDILSDSVIAETSELHIKSLISSLEEEIVRGDILKGNPRIDGRDHKTVRQIATETGILSGTHGSALFTRGETQALVVTTLGSAGDEQLIDGLDGDHKQRFLLHYTFPPYSVNETSQLKPPGRREIGHGKLAYRSMTAVMPSHEDFSYTIRVASEITESNGSSSMATVCGTSLALMDAGVPIKDAVAGIAMGLIKEGKQFVVLSDIMGDEDHLGDMDFKVAGTKDGVTALQMDIKISGIDYEIMRVALDQAKDGRIHILGKMAETMTQAKESLNENAPCIKRMTINKDKIREVIGSGGKVIKSICEATGAKVDIDESGEIRIFGADQALAEKAKAMIDAIVAEPEVNKVYEGKIVKIVEFGAFVNFLGSRDGLLHISEIGDDKIGDYKENDLITVRVASVDSRGKIKLVLVGEGRPEKHKKSAEPKESSDSKEEKPADASGEKKIASSERRNFNKKPASKPSRNSDERPSRAHSEERPQQKRKYFI